MYIFCKSLCTYITLSFMQFLFKRGKKEKQIPSRLIKNQFAKNEIKKETQAGSSTLTLQKNKILSLLARLY